MTNFESIRAALRVLNSSRSGTERDTDEIWSIDGIYREDSRVST